jgi:hypothetical protein
MPRRRNEAHSDSRARAGVLQLVPPPGGLDLQADLDSRRAAVPLTKLRFRCSQWGTGRTDFVVTSRDNPQTW